MTDTRDPKPRPLIHTLLAGAVSGFIRTVLDWIIDTLGFDKGPRAAL